MLSSNLHTYLLAQGFGLYFFIMAIILFSRREYYRVKLVQESSYPSVLSCSLLLFVGIFLVLLHNEWVLLPRVMVTVVCWTFLIRAVLLLAAPERMLAINRKICMGKGYYVCILIMGVLGVLLMTRGIYLYAVHAGVLS